MLYRIKSKTIRPKLTKQITQRIVSLNGEELKQSALKCFKETGQVLSVALINPAYQEPARQHKGTEENTEGLAKAEGCHTHDEMNVFHWKCIINSY